MTAVKAHHTPPPTTEVMNVWKSAAPSSTETELRTLVVRHGEKFTFDSG
jgi:hypothetical protein